MELVILAGMGLAGYYINTNDPVPNPPNIPITPNQIANGPDIYNQNRLSVVESEQLKLNKTAFNKSQYPQHTNIIPTSYNKLAPFMREPRPIPNQYLVDPIDIQFSPAEDLDLIWKNMPFKDQGSVERNRRAEQIVGTPNQVFKSNDIDTGHLFLNDEYEMFRFENQIKPYKIPGVQANMNPTRVPTSDKHQKRTASQIIEAYTNSTNNPDRDLLDVSESLTDNSDSIRNILSNVNNNLGTPIRLTPEQMAKSNRLVGVTPDYESINIDGDIASYPAFNRPGQTVHLKRLDQPNKPVQPVQNNSSLSTPSFLDQFDEQTYDNEGFPAAPNDIYQTSDKSRLSDMERQLAFQGGWTQFNQSGSMSYGIVPDDQLIHDNQIPFFKEKSGYGSNDLHSSEQMDRNRNLFTGNLTVEWRKKQEIPRLFEPVKDLSFIYGTPVRPEGEESRLFTSRYRNNEKLFTEERVTPGLNLDYNEIGTAGYQDLVRVYPKTVDELRVATDPKISYEGRLIPGMKGVARPVQAAVVSHRPDGFKTTTEADLLPTTDVNTGPRSRENFIMKETDRSTTSTEYAGPAFNKSEAVDQIGPDNIRPKVKCSTRQNFVLPKPLQKYAKDETVYNPNLVSYNLQPNARSDTGQNDYVGPVNQTTGPKLNYTDVAKPTLKESMPSYVPTNVANTMRGTVIQMDLAKPTIRQTTDQPLNPNAPSLNTAQKVYYTDPAKQTTKETTQTQIDPTGVYQSHNIYANLTDTPRITMAETVVSIPRNTHVLAVGQSQRQPNYTDDARPTTRSDTSQIPTQTVVTPVGQAQGSVPLQDQTRTTMRENTTQIPLQTFATPVGQSQGAVGPQDQMRQTTRETTTNLPQNNFITPIGQSQGTVGPQDQMRQTTRETTTGLAQPTFVVPVGQAQRAPTYTDHTRTTIRQTTVQTPWNTNVTPVGQTQGSVPVQDQFKTTTRESTVQLAQSTFVTPIGQSQRAPNYTDPAKNTTKETTVVLSQPTFVVPVGQSVGSAHLQDFTRTTMREQTTQLSQNNFVTAVGQSQGAVPLQDQTRTTLREQTTQSPQNTFVTAVGQAQGSVPLQDQTRTTIREQTASLPQNNFVQAVGQARGAVPLQDSARSTIREQTTQLPQNNFIQAVGQAQGAVPLQDSARSTIREQTTQLPQNNFVTAVGQAQGAVGLQDPVRPTIKESTVNNEYISGPVSTYGSGYGYISTTIDVPNTNRQFTTQEVYVPPVSGITKPTEYSSAYNARVSDMREVTQVYRSPTLSGVKVGPNANLTQTHLKIENNRAPIIKPMYAVNNNLDRQQSLHTAKSIDNIPLNLFVDPNILTQLKNNPFSIPAYYGSN